MHHRRHLVTALLGLSLLAAGLFAPAATFAASPTPSVAAAAEAACTNGHWPASVQGRPTLLHAGARAGDYIWHNADGWHLRVTHANTLRRVFSGRIVATAPMAVTPYRLETGDSVVLSADKLVITYRFLNYGRLDGLDFTTACARRVTFGGSMSGAKLPISRIWVGYRNHHPLQNPFSVTKVS
jgi:hypothetical protein